MNREISIRQLSIGYRERHHQVTVMEGLNGTIHGGELTCLLGPNGVGKSTLLKTLSAFQPPLSGQVLLDGNDLSTFTPHQLARQVGVVLTAKPEAQHLTVEEIVGMGRMPYTGFWGTLQAEDRQVVTRAIDMMGLQGLRGRMAGQLSDGESQRMMIAKALAQQTPVIFLDEPTAFLDFPGKVELMRLLRRVAHETGKIVFLSTHDVEMALQVADRIWLMLDHGLSVGTPQELSDQGALSRFLDRAGIHYDPATRTIKI